MSKMRTRLSLAFVAMAVMMITVLPATSASAHGGTITFVGTAQLSGGIGVCPSSGSAQFTVAGTHGTTPVEGNASASFTYCNSDIVAGTASGTLNVTLRPVGGGAASQFSCAFSWVRTGATAAITFSSGCAGSATAAFAPAGNTAAVTGTASITSHS
jgi:hypothetical protein